MAKLSTPPCKPQAGKSGSFSHHRVFHFERNFSAVLHILPENAPPYMKFLLDIHIFWFRFFHDPSFRQFCFSSGNLNKDVEITMSRRLDSYRAAVTLPCRKSTFFLFPLAVCGIFCHIKLRTVKENGFPCRKRGLFQHRNPAFQCPTENITSCRVYKH